VALKFKVMIARYDEFQIYAMSVIILHQCTKDRELSEQLKNCESKQYGSGGEQMQLYCAIQANS